MLTDSCEVVQYKQKSVERKTTEPIQQNRGSVPQYLRFESWGRYSKFMTEVSTMKILSITQTSMGLVTCAVVDRQTALDLVLQYEERRADIWCGKYPEVRGKDGKETDPLDRLSKYIVLFYVDEFGKRIVIGGCRIIYAAVGEELPVQACVVSAIAGPAVEISRFYIGSEAIRIPREDSLPLYRGFILGMADLLREEGFKYAYATILHTLYLKLRRIRLLPMEQIGEPTTHGEWSFVPTVFDLEEQQLEVPAQKAMYSAHA
jgi:N-acyl-L-homoserine lactone synthetase